ncbi:S-layer homology domain-containing protein [Anaerotignum sp.]
MKKTRKRGLAWLMTLAMIVSLLPMTAWAENDNEKPVWGVIFDEDLPDGMAEFDFSELGYDISATIELDTQAKLQDYPDEVEYEGKTYGKLGFWRYGDEGMFIDSSDTIIVTDGVDSDGLIIAYGEGESNRVGSASKTDYYNITATIEAFDADGNSVGYKPLGNISLLTKNEEMALNSDHDANGVDGWDVGKTVARRTNVREDTELRVVLEIYEGNHDYIFQGFRLVEQDDYLEDQEISDKLDNIAEKREAAFEVKRDMNLLAVFVEEPGKGEDREFGELKVTGGDYVYIPKEIFGEIYDPEIVLFEDGDYTVAMDEDTEVAKEEHLTVFSGIDADITLDNVQMEMANYAIQIRDYGGETKADLILKGTNSMKGHSQLLYANGVTVGFLMDAEAPGTLTVEAVNGTLNLDFKGKLMHDDMYVWVGEDKDSATLVASGANAEFSESDFSVYDYLHITPYNGETFEYFDFNNAEDKFFTDEEQRAATQAAAKYNMALAKYNSFGWADMTWAERQELTQNPAYRAAENAYLEAKAEYDKHLTNSTGDLFKWFERRMEENGISSKGKLNALKNFAAEKWGGSCFGFSAVAAMFHSEEMSLHELRLFDENALDLPTTTEPKADTDVRELLNYYLVLQNLPEVRGTMRYLSKTDDQKYLLDLAERLARATDAGTEDPVIFLYFMDNGTGHAVTLDGAVRNADGSYTVMVEDNRFFGQELATDVVLKNGAISEYKLTGQDINPVLEISKDGKKAVMTFEGGWTTRDEESFSKYPAFKETLTRYEVITNYELLKDYFPGEYTAPVIDKKPAIGDVTVIDRPIFWIEKWGTVIVDPGDGEEEPEKPIIDPLRPIYINPGQGNWQAFPLNPPEDDDKDDGYVVIVDPKPGDQKVVEFYTDMNNLIDYTDMNNLIDQMMEDWQNVWYEKMNLTPSATVSVDENLNVVMEYAPATAMAQVEARDQYAAVNPDGTIEGKVAYAEGDIYSGVDTAKADAAVFDPEGAVGLAGNEGDFEITVTRNDGDELARISGDAYGEISVVPTEDGITAIIPAGVYQVTFIDKDGKETVQSFTTEGGLASIGKDGAVEVPEMIPASELPFTDVKANDWFYNAVKYVYENGLMSGTSETTFSPAVTTSRGMITSILWRMEGRPEAAAEVPFKDVAKDAYYAEAIAWAAENGIVSGYDADRFGPNDPITREQLASILFRYAKFKGYDVSVGENTNILSYKDAFEISEYAIPAMQWACGAGIISGNTDGTLNPDGQAQRSHAAQMLMKFENHVK